MRRWLVTAIVLAACASEFAASSIGVRREPGEGTSIRYVHRDSGVGFVLPVAADAGEREEDDAGFERVVMTAHADDRLYRVVVLRPIDGTEVQPADAITRLADGLVESQEPTRDEGAMVGTHAARRISLPHTDRDGHAGAFLIAADDRALVMLELVGPGDLDAAAATFFGSLELGCDR